MSKGWNSELLINNPLPQSTAVDFKDLFNLILINYNIIRGLITNIF